MATIGSVVVSFNAKTGKFDRSVKRSGRNVKSFARTIKRAAIVAVAAFAGMAAAAALVAVPLIKAASQAEEVQSKFAAVFRDSAKDVADWARTYSDRVGFANTATMGWLATLQDTFVPMGIARDQGAALSQQMVELAGDLFSFNPAVSSVDQVIGDLQSALVGNHETLRKYGIVINETSLKAEALSSGITRNVKAMTEQEKILARVNLIMKGTADAQGDLDRTSGSFKNTLQRVTGQWQTFKEVLGAPLRDIATIQLEKLAKVLTTVTPKMADFLDRMKLGLLTSQFLWDNWGRLVELNITRLASSLETLAEDVKHVFAVIAGELKRGSVIWAGTLADMRQQATLKGKGGALFAGIGVAAAELTDALGITNARGLIDTFSTITSAFGFALDPLPAIAERQMSAVEQIMKATIAGMEASLSQDLGAFLLKKQRELEIARAKAQRDFGGGGAAGDDDALGAVLAAGSPRALLRGSRAEVSARTSAIAKDMARDTKRTADNTQSLVASTKNVLLVLKKGLLDPVVDAI